MQNIVLTQYSKDDLKEIIRDCLKDELKSFNQNTEKDNSEEKLISIEDVQKIFKVSKVTIHKWKRQGILPFHKVGRRLYFKKAELLEAVSSKPKKYNF